MKRLKLNFTVFVVLMVSIGLMTGCEDKGSSSSGGDSSSAANVAGVWTGTYSTSLISNNVRELQFTLQQSGTNVNGTYWRTFSISGCGAGSLSSTINGTINGNTFSFTMDKDSQCSGTFNGTATISGNTMTLSFTGSDCCGTHNNGQGTITK